MKENLDLKELMQAFIDGKKVRESCWPSDDYIYFKNNEFVNNKGNEISCRDVFLEMLRINIFHFWDLYDENQPDLIDAVEMNDFQWALSEAKKGIPVARRGWGLDSYQVMKVFNDRLTIKDFGSQVSYRYTPDVSSLEANDWYVYTTQTKENEVYKRVQRLRSEAFDDLAKKFNRNADAISREIFINPEVEIEVKTSIYIGGERQND